MGIHATAIVDSNAILHESVEVGPFCTIGAGVKIGKGTKLVSHVVLQGNVTIGEDNEIFPFASLGQPPQDLKFDGETTELIIGNNNSIRESVTMSLGTKGGGGVTSIGDNNLFMALAHVGHDCHIENNCVFANGATLGGHVYVGDNAIIGGLSAVHQFVRIGQHVIVGGVSPVVRDVIPFGAVSGNRAHLDGLNLVGLRRRGFERETIKALMAAYKMVFESSEGSVEDRACQAVATYTDIPEVAEWVSFIEDSERGLCMPKNVGDDV